jgi:hypothetical protein
MSKQTVLGILKEVYFDISSGNTKNYSQKFIEDMKKVRGDINNQISLLKSCGVAYSDSAMMKILENVGVKKYF